MWPSAVREIRACRSCGSSRLDRVISLGMHAISDFVEDPTTLERAPLVLVRCHDCTLVQLQHTVPRDRLYRNYWYRSGVQEAMVAALREVVEDACHRVDIQPGDQVMDIGANDGTLLRQYPSSLKRFGVEPAKNLYVDACRGGNAILPDYWPPAYPLINMQAKIITTIAMFYDLDDPNAFVAAVRDCLATDGIWVIQMAYLPEMLRQNAFDNICHEHLEYYSLWSLQQLLWRHRLRIVDYSFNAVNGGSIRVIVKHGPPGVDIPEVPIGGSWEQGDMRGFARRVEREKQAMIASLENKRALGQVVIGYGASTKGNTLLQYYGIGPELLPAIADRNPDKWGKKSATGIPIISEEEMRRQRPGYLLALPWHFIDAFREREKSLLAEGTRFIVPLPRLREVADAKFSA